MRVISPILDKFKNWYEKYDRPLSSVFLVGGFIFDSLTLKRVDTLWENLWVAFHLLVVSVAILMLNLDEDKKETGKKFARGHFWLVNILQFSFGGLFSIFLIFYFRSATLVSTWPFLLLLIIAVFANESLKKHYERLIFQISLLFLSVFSFTIFSVPILVHQIGVKIFLLSGMVSLLVISIFLFVLYKISRNDFNKEKYKIYSAIGGIYLIFNLLYFTNLIPPLPLSLKEGGIYHSINKNMDGNYISTYEDNGWLGYFQAFDDFHLVPGYPVYAYSAIFSPSNLNLNIIHEWQYFDEATRRWETKSKINLNVLGGRENGFRTFSQSYNLTPGKWRVNVKTERDQIIGRLLFNIVNTEVAPQLLIKVNE